MAADDNSFLNDTSQFDYQKTQAKNQAGADLQSQRDAMQRRFAQLGNLNSGTQFQIDQNAVTANQQGLSNKLQGIDAAQNAELERRKEILQGQGFQTSERVAGQGFQTGERLGAQDYATGAQKAAFGQQTSERLGSQDYATGAQKLAFGQQTSERLGGQDFASGQNQINRVFQTSERIGAQKFAGNQNQANRDLQSFSITTSDAQQKAAQTEQNIVDAATIKFNSMIVEKQDPLTALVNQVFGGGGGGGGGGKGILPDIPGLSHGASQGIYSAIGEVAKASVLPIAPFIDGSIANALKNLKL